MGAHPGRRGREIGGDIVGSALYVVNWVLAGRSVDYLSQDAPPSPVQHFWSLAIEEQFYVVWPLALIVLVLVLRRRGSRLLAEGQGRGPGLQAVGIVLAALAVPSLAYSVWHTITVPAHAYFATTTRLWELGIGASLAVWAAHRHMRPVPYAAPLAWAGMAAIVAPALWLPVGAGWPGAWALVPTVGTALVILAGWDGPAANPGSAADRGPGAGGVGPDRLLSLAPMVWVGGLSYSLYLWHWPFAVFADELWPGGSAGPGRSWPVPCPPGWGTGSWSGPCTTAPASRGAPEVPGAGPRAVHHRRRRGHPPGHRPPLFRTTPAAGQLPPLEQLGAGVLGDTPSADPAAYSVDDWGWLTPDPERAGEDRPAADVDRCQVDERTSTPVRCEFGVADGSVTIALVGDSKALQWLPALERWPGEGLEDRHLRQVLLRVLRGHDRAVPAALRLLRPLERGCGQGSVGRPARPRRDLHPGRCGPPGRTGVREALADYLARRWQGLQRAGVPVAVIGDNPGSPADLDSCMARNPRQLTRCAFDRQVAIDNTGIDAQRAAALRAQGVQLIDLTPWICPVEQCPAAIGNVVIHRAGDHITATYAKTLGPQIARQLDAVMARESR